MQVGVVEEKGYDAKTRKKWRRKRGGRVRERCTQELEAREVGKAEKAKKKEGEAASVFVSVVSNGGLLLM